jgi:hypothetical protein
MDPFFAKQIYKSPYHSHFNQRLTPFQSSPNPTIPGSGLPAQQSNVMVPLHGESPYLQDKSTLQSGVNGLENKMELTDIESQSDARNTQQGFGFKGLKGNNPSASTSSNNSDPNDMDIDSDSLKTVDEAILKSFEAPVIRTSTINYKPVTKRKSTPLEGRGAIESKKPKKDKQFVGKLKFL